MGRDNASRGASPVERATGLGCLLAAIWFQACGGGAFGVSGDDGGGTGGVGGAAGGDGGATDRGAAAGGEGGQAAGDCACEERESCVGDECVPWECTPGERFCSANGVRVCAESGLSSAEVEPCGEGRYCHTESASCRDGLCEPNEPACSGDSVRFCNADGTGYEGTEEPCATGTSCEDGACKTHVCTPNQSFCQGRDIKLCADNGLASAVEETCEDDCVESTDGAGCPGPCTPGQKQCSGNAVQTCTEDGEWGMAAPCTDPTPTCSQGTCVAGDPEPPSCRGLAANCGSNGDESCCTSSVVTGGTFALINDSRYPATLSDFRLDKYEVTVGRFRKFVDAVVDEWRPSAESGKHAHLNGGSGLNNSATNDYEPGWSSSWDRDDATYRIHAAKIDWDVSLLCSSTSQTWTPSVGENETRPINCVNWYQAYAFCIWDGGFLPSEAEWNYAAAGGNEQRDYPWGATVPSANAALAVHGCYYNGTGTCTTVVNIATVGAVPAGDGRHGQSDLAGNMFEWNLDAFAEPGVAFPASCTDCAYLQLNRVESVLRGGAFHSAASSLLSSSRGNTESRIRNSATGFRCARAP